jgi:hypothetical protein
MNGGGEMETDSAISEEVIAIKQAGEPGNLGGQLSFNCYGG